jgi:DNA-binding CsgD family transcriptional regulator
VLEHIAEGSCRDEIADVMNCSLSSVNQYLTNTFNKMGASNAAHAVALGIRAGVIG